MIMRKKNMQTESCKGAKKINGHEVRFTSYPDNRVVIAEIHRCDEDVFDWLVKECGLEYPIFSSPGSTSLLDSSYMPVSLKAVAKCHPEDEFVQGVGEDVAYKKLQKKYWEKYAVRAMKLHGNLSRVLSSLYDEMHRAAMKAASINPGVNVKS